MSFHDGEATAASAYPGLYFGTTGKGRRLRYREANLSSLIIGKPGAMKTLGLVVPNLSHLRQSMIIADSKGGQVAAMTAGRRAEMGRVLVINPLNLYADRLSILSSCGWNPLLQLNVAKNFEQDAAAISSAIITKAAQESGNSKFFDTTGENALTLFIMRERKKNSKRPDMRNVVIALSEPSIFSKKGEPVGGFAHSVKEMTTSENFAIRTLSNRIYARLQDKRSQNTSLQDTIDTVFKEFRFLYDDRVAYDMFHGDAIDWASLHKEIVTIYLVLPVEELDPSGLGKWLRIFINLALRGLYQNAPTFGATLPRVLMILDEFAAIGRLEEIPKALGTARDSSLTMMFILQSLRQLVTHYPNEWPLFFAGSGAKCTFRAGDFETAEYFCKIIGESERKVTTESLNGSSSFTPHAIPLIRPEDLMRLPPGITVNLIDPCPFPILARVPFYKETPWAEGLDPNPNYRG